MIPSRFMTHFNKKIHQFDDCPKKNKKKSLKPHEASMASGLSQLTLMTRLPHDIWTWGSHSNYVDLRRWEVLLKKIPGLANVYVTNWKICIFHGQNQLFRWPWVPWLWKLVPQIAMGFFAEADGVAGKFAIHWSYPHHTVHEKKHILDQLIGGLFRYVPGFNRPFGGAGFLKILSVSYNRTVSWPTWNWRYESPLGPINPTRSHHDIPNNMTKFTSPSASLWLRRMDMSWSLLLYPSISSICLIPNGLTWFHTYFPAHFFKSL